jgi:hypothetical protein
VTHKMLREDHQFSVAIFNNLNAKEGRRIRLRSLNEVFIHLVIIFYIQRKLYRYQFGDWNAANTSAATTM